MPTSTPYAQPMECADVHAGIRAGRVDDENLRVHAASCASCAELLADGAALGRTLAGVETRASAAGDVMTRVRADRSLRSAAARMPSATRRWLVALLLVLPALAVSFVAPRPDLALYPTVRMVITLAGLAGAGLLVSAVVLRPLHRGAPAAGSLRVALALALPVLLAALPEVVTGHPASRPDVDLLDASLHCFLTGSVLAAVTFVGLAWTERRRRVPVAWLVAAVGLAAFTGALALQITCSMTAPAHLVFGHGLLGAVWAAVIASLVTARRAVAPA